MRSLRLLRKTYVADLMQRDVLHLIMGMIVFCSTPRVEDANIVSAQSKLTLTGRDGEL